MVRSVVRVLKQAICTSKYGLLTFFLCYGQERITSTNKGSITSVQAVYVPADDLTDPAPATTFAHLDATTVRRCTGANCESGANKSVARVVCVINHWAVVVAVSCVVLLLALVRRPAGFLSMVNLVLRRNDLGGVFCKACKLGFVRRRDLF